MHVTQYSNGTQLVSDAYTEQELLVILQPMVCDWLGINPPDYSQVRLDWQTAGEPGFVVGQDTTSLRTTEENLNYNKIRDLTNIPNVLDPTTVIAQYTYQRTWRVFFTSYGPNCVDRARCITDAVFLDWVAEALEDNGLYLVPDFDRPVYLSELHSGQWWKRCDLSICFNESVQEQIVIPTVGSVEVRVELVEDGATEVIADINVTPA